MHPRLRNLLLAKPRSRCCALGLTPAAAGPEGGTVVGGAATIQGQGGASVIINQSSSSAIINWNTFNIRANESVRFNQPSSSSVALNRVTGGLGPSEIMGTLTANGRVFVINRDGILFGPGSVVNTAGFLATTNDIKNADFMAGRYNFNIPGRPDASIVNRGTITATSGGFAALVAPGVRNSGTITATLGTVALASGNSFTLDMYGDKLITLAVGDSIASKVIDVATGRPLKSLVSNTKNGTLSANGGRVELTAAAARAVVDSVINTRGVIRADSIGRHNGMIVLNAATGGSKPAGAPTQTIKLAGTLSAAGKHRGTKGGTIVVSGEHIKIANAKIDASGRRGGGKVMVGGDWGGGNPNKSLVKNNQSATLEDYAIGTATTVSIDGRTTINASATRRGNGGKVVIWSDTQTTFAGTILARGGTQGGDGGFVETSSHGQLAFAGNVNAGAPRGIPGALLLDPEDILIDNAAATAISNSLANNDVTITTNPNISGNGDIALRGGAHVAWNANTTLTLSAYHDILFQPGSSISNGTNANPGAGNLILRADNSGIGSGTVVFPSTAQSGQVDFSHSTGAVSIYYNPSTGNPSQTKYQNPTDFSCCVSVQQSSQLTAYMLVNNVNDLQAVSSSLGGTYALGRSFSAAGFTGYAPGTTFTGLFDGNGGLGASSTISNNYTISDLSLSSSSSPVALFPFVESGATVRNLNLANVNITGTGSLIFLGTLAGENHGTISNVHILGGTVAGGSQTGVVAGGLVAKNEGLIENSSSAANVSVGANSIVGGFAGLSGGTILLSTSSGAVTATSESYLGGFAGVNLGTIQSSTALASVSGTGNHDIVGGFVGANFGSIDGSSSAGTASGSTNSAVGGFAGANARFINFPAGSIPGSSFPVGTITNSTATGAATGGQGSTVDPFIALNDPTSASNLPAFPSILAGCSNPLCGFLNTGILPTAGSLPTAVSLPPATLLPPFSPESLASLPGPVQVINNLVGQGPSQFAALNAAAPVFNTVLGGIRLPPQQQPLGPTGSQQGQQQLPVGFDRRVIDIPPPSETRFVKDEVVFQIAGNVTVERLEAAVGRLGLTRLASENLAITGSTVVRFRITDGRSPAEIIPALAAIQLVAVAQPNYVYTLQQQPGGLPSPAHDDTTQGDPAQYILEKLKIVDVHRMVRGTNVPIAVIDSQIDVTHPDLEGAVAQRFDAAGAPEKPHPHGTGMAGAIAAHQRLLGTAPAARLLAVHAFSASATTAESTTFNILKGINWSAQEGARIINMSFAGPSDPSLARALKAAYDKGIVLIAAAGNAGPKSPPLFPGADPYVIAVTATDVDDKLFTGANRGKYISVAAPGVDILVPAPEGEYQITTGTSVAAAEVSGIVALLLERNPKLTPADIRRILTASAKRLAPGERDDNFGSGLIDPLQALQLADPRIATTTPPRRR